MNAYLTVIEANKYFDERLNSEDWEWASAVERLKALKTATRLMDRLNYIGEKTDKDQELEFPRGGDTKVPREIQWACCEIAIKMLSGLDSDMEVDALGTIKSEFTTIKTTYDRQLIREYQAMGMLSSLAFDFLRPYLYGINSVSLERAN